MVLLVLDRIRSDRTRIFIRSGPYAYGPNTHMVWNIYTLKIEVKVDLDICFLC